MPNYSLGIDLGGTAIKLVATDGNAGEPLHQSQVPTRDGETVDGKPAFAHGARLELKSISDQLGGAPKEIGVSAPGLASRGGRSINYMPGRLEGLEHFDWGEFLDRPGKVPVINDAHAALLGEVGYGAAREMRDVVMLTLGTGVGGAIISGGRLLRGHIGRAGHLGHITTDFRAPGDICGTPGSLEDAIGFCTLEQRCGGKFSSTTELVAAAADGDSEARRVWDESIRALAASIASLANALDPKAVILGGGIANAGDALFDPLAKFLDEFEWRPAGHRVKVLPAQLGEWAGAFGAAHLAQNPDSY